MSSSSRLALLAALALVGLLLPLPAQTTAQGAHQDAVISVPVVVHRKHGELAQHLTAADFTLTDNTHPQTIASFAPNPTQPLTIGLLFETDPTQSSTLREKVHASEQFLDGLLPVPQTSQEPKAFVIQFSRDVDLLEDPSDSRSKDDQALSQVGVAQFNGDSNATVTASNFTTNKSGRSEESGATLYDAIDLAASEVLAKSDGRKVMVVLSDGIDRGSKTTLNGAVEAAQRAGVAVYAIYFKGGEPPMEFRPGRNRTMGNPGSYPGSYPSEYPGSYPNGYPGSYPGGYPDSYPSGGSPASAGTRRVDGKKMLEDICEHTGGELFDSRKEKLSSIYAAITQQMNEAYILQYTRTQAATEPGFHHIRLTPKQKDLIVQMTEGYWLGED